MFIDKEFIKLEVKNKAVFFLVIYFIFSLLIFFTPLANWLAIPFKVSPKLEKLDSIIVLSGGAYANGILAIFTYDRLVYGLTLYNKGMAPKIVMVGRSGPKGDSDAELMQKIAMGLGVKQENILVGNESLNTYENIKEIRQIMERNHFKSALVVTSPVHMKRVMMLAENQGVNLFPAPVPSADEYRNDPADKGALFYSEVWEVLALTWYKVRGWL